MAVRALPAALIALLMMVSPWSPLPLRVVFLAFAAILVWRSAASLGDPPRLYRRPRKALRWMLRVTVLSGALSLLPFLAFLEVTLLFTSAAIALVVTLWLVLFPPHEEFYPPYDLWSQPLASILKAPALTRKSTERWVEVPWTAESLPQDGRILDLGYVNGDVHYHELLCTAKRQVFGLDLAKGEINGIRGCVGDARSMPFAADSFDAVVAISTIEHIGLDNTKYAVEGDQAGTAGDFQALAEIARILRPGGCALITVPFGAPEDLGWMRQYDNDRLQRLIRSFPGASRVDYFQYRCGWRRAEAPDLTHARYGGGEAPAATGLACLCLQKK